MKNLKTSYNNTLILKPYLKTKELETTQISTGFVGVKNKVSLEGLELLVDARAYIGDCMIYVRAGSTLYFKQSTLHVQKWPREIYESEEFPEGFVLGRFDDVVYVDQPKED